MMSLRYSTRLVFIFKKIVIKIPISYRGYLQCKNEKNIYDKYKNTNLLGKLYFEKFGIICMKRYNVVKKIEYKNVYNIKSIIKEFDFDNCDLFNPDNWGVENDEYFLIDYGINEDISKMY